MLAVAKMWIVEGLVFFFFFQILGEKKNILSFYYRFSIDGVRIWMESCDLCNQGVKNAHEPKLE